MDLPGCCSRQGAAILQLFAGKYQPLLVRWDAFFVLDLGLDILVGVTGLDLKRNGLDPFFKRNKE